MPTITLVLAAGLAVAVVGSGATVLGRIRGVAHGALLVLWLIIAAALALAPDPVVYRLAAIGMGEATDVLLWLWAMLTVGLPALFRRGGHGDLPAGLLLGMVLLPLATVALEGWSPGNTAGARTAASVGALVLLMPVFLYLGLAGWAVPYVLALAGMLGGTGWEGAARRWSAAVWTLLGAGILHGARWSYGTTPAGDFWGWAPGAAAALLPWLAGALPLVGDLARRPWLAFVPLPVAAWSTVWLWTGGPLQTTGAGRALLVLAILTLLLPVCLGLAGGSLAVSPAQPRSRLPGWRWGDWALAAAVSGSGVGALYLWGLVHPAGLLAAGATGVLMVAVGRGWARDLGRWQGQHQAGAWQCIRATWPAWGRACGLALALTGAMMAAASLGGGALGRVARTVDLRPGASVTVGPYELTNLGVGRLPGPFARVLLNAEGKGLGPRVLPVFPGMGPGRTLTLSGRWHDLRVTAMQARADGEVTFLLGVSELPGWVQRGQVLLVLGGVLLLWENPGRRGHGGR